MAVVVKPIQWRAVAKTVRGASHIRLGIPNQDAIDWYPRDQVGPPLLMAVSDGHGSARSFRSHRGARLAVRVVTEVMGGLLNSPQGPLSATTFSEIKRWLEERLPGELVRKWQAMVLQDYQKRPLSEDEIKNLESASSPPLDEDIWMAYGATLITVLVMETFIAYVQLGDGDILVVTEQGEVSRPLPRDERLFANETTSLCTKDAWRDFRFGFQVLTENAPALILISTDGYSNSFRDEAGFLKVGSDILDLLRKLGLQRVDQEMKGWLKQTSQRGSGDDISLGLICRMDVLSAGGLDVL